MKILIIHGPNLNLLGKRDTKKYGTITIKQINQTLQNTADKMSIEVEFFQSNHEGALIDFLQKKSSRQAQGIMINPGALTRYAYSLRQALIDHGKPVIEIHMSNIDKTGINKKINILDDVRTEQIVGLKENSYYTGFKKLVDIIKSLQQ